MKTLLSIDLPNRGISLRTCFVGFAYLLSALGVACLMFGEVIPMAAGLVFLAAIAVCFTLEMRQKIPVLPPFRFPLWIAGLVILPLVYFVWDVSPMDLVAWYLIGIMLTRFLYKAELNDYLYGYIIAIVCLLVGAIFIQNIVFGFIFLAFYLVLSWCLMFYNMMVERVGGHCPPSGFRRAGEHEFAGLSLFGLSSTMILGSLILTAAIFLSFPRLGLGFLELDAGGSPVSGFSNRVELGAVGRIKQNDSVVMRVEFRKNGELFRPRGKVLWRGVNLDYYDGKTWASSLPMVWNAWNKRGRGARLFSVPAPKDVVVQDIYMEAFNSPVIFTYGLPLKIEGTFKRIQMDQGYSIQSLDNHTGPKRFTMISDIAHPEITHSEPVFYSSRKLFPQRFLQLPPVSRRTSRLAHDLVNPQDSDLTKAGKIDQYLHDNFGYSLDMDRETRGSPLDDFLFERKEGHCEYFASAMAVLLRINGIPSRVITGFMGVEWNDLGNYMVVRQAHAHSWVEAYIEGKGWHVFDPTPPDPAAAANGPNALARRFDLMRLYWQRYVVRYSMQDQFQMVQYFNRETRELTDKIKNWEPMSFKETMAFIKKHPAWLVLPLAGWLLWRFWSRKKEGRRMFGTERPPYAVDIYRQMLKRLEAHGIRKAESSTHLEFLNRLTGLPPEKEEAVRTITRFYEQIRFGDGPVSAKDKRRIQLAIQQI